MLGGLSVLERVSAYVAKFLNGNLEKEKEHQPRSHWVMP